MIPEFPNFKKIELSDRKEVEEFTSKFPPYSDFNFTSLWTWDTNDERMLSILNDNLVVRFTDYETRELSFSFLGINEPRKTAQELINFAEKVDLAPVLCFISEETTKKLDGSDLFIEEDRNNFDYIFSVSQLAELRGSKYKTKRHSAEKFLHDYPNASFELKNLSGLAVREQVISVFQRWKNKKKSDKKTYDFEYEEKAISRLMRTGNDHKVMLSCVFLHDVIIGFSIDEILPQQQYAISHFFKADNSYSGIYDFLNKKVSQYLATSGVLFWNWEQDLGIENIRKSKMSYRPTSFLKKYKVSLTKKG